MKRPVQLSTTLARWGLLVVAIALAVLLVGMGLAGWWGAQQTSRAVTRARGLDILMTLRRNILRARDNPQLALDEAMVDFQDQGLRYVAILRRDGTPIAEAGSAESPLSPDFLRGLRPRHGVHTQRVGDRVQVVVALGARRMGWPGGVGAGGPPPWAPGKRHRWGKSPPRPWADSGRLPEWLEHSRHRGAVLVLELEPIVGRAVIQRAAIMLGVSLASATVLLIAAVILWRLSRKSEQMARQLARDRQLKALGQMSAVLGHELRNPLASLKGHAQLLVERLEEGSKTRRGAERVVREALRMEKLTEQILDFARTGTVEPEEVKPADLARAAIEQVEGGTIDLELSGSLPESWPLDRLRVERVLVNFLRNAVQATPEGEEVKLVVRRADEGLLFEVLDRGPGIAPGEEEWIFEPFHTKRVQGTGLGLAVSKQIVEAHGGRVGAANRPEGGAVFFAWFPPEPSSGSPRLKG